MKAFKRFMGCVVWAVVSAGVIAFCFINDWQGWGVLAWLVVSAVFFFVSRPAFWIYFLGGILAVGMAAQG